MLIEQKAKEHGKWVFLPGLICTGAIIWWMGASSISAVLGVIVGTTLNIVTRIALDWREIFAPDEYYREQLLRTRLEAWQTDLNFDPLRTMREGTNQERQRMRQICGLGDEQ